MTLLLLVLTSIVAWFFSMLAGGGSSLILIPIVEILLGVQAIPPTITIGGILGNAYRVRAYSNKISWSILKWELPSAIVGAISGSFVFTQLDLEWLRIIVAIFLILSSTSFFLKGNHTSFTVKTWYFLPAGFIYAFLSALIGSMGPIITPFYINYGLNKEELLGTQATSRLVIHGIKIVAYGLFGALQSSYIAYGVLIGLAVFPGNWLGSLVLERISKKRFEQLVFSFVMISGFLTLWKSRELLGIGASL